MVNTVGKRCPGAGSVHRGHAQILIGQTAGFTGQVAAGVKEITDGAQLYIQAVNAKGGVNGQNWNSFPGRQVRPQSRRRECPQADRRKQCVGDVPDPGTPHTQAMIPLLEKYGVVLVAPSTGAMVLHEPVSKYIFNVRATTSARPKGHDPSGLDGHHADCPGVLGRQLWRRRRGQGPEGSGSQQAETRRARKIQPRQTRLCPIVAKMVAADAQAVLRSPRVLLVVEAGAALRAAGSSAQIVTLSNNASGGFIKSLGEHARGVVVTQVFPTNAPSPMAW